MQHKISRQLNNLILGAEIDIVAELMDFQDGPDFDSQVNHLIERRCQEFLIEEVNRTPDFLMELKENAQPEWLSEPSDNAFLFNEVKCHPYVCAHGMITPEQIANLLGHYLLMIASEIGNLIKNRSKA